MMVKYTADFSYGSPTLTRLFIEKDTPQTIVVADYENLMGVWSRGKGPVMKRSVNLFDSPLEAIQFLMGRIKKGIERTERELERLHAQYDELKTAHDKLSAADTSAD